MAALIIQRFFCVCRLLSLRELLTSREFHPIRDSKRDVPMVCVLASSPANDSAAQSRLCAR